MSRQEQFRLVGVARGKFGYLLVALIALLMSAPVMTESWMWKILLAVLVGGVLVAGLYAVRPGRRAIVTGLGLASVEFTINRLAATYENQWLLLAQILLWIVALLYVTVSILEWVLSSPEVTLATLQAAFCVYLLLGLLWAYVYALMAVTRPDSFRPEQGPALVRTDERSRRVGFLHLVVFSYSTLSGTGLADVYPTNSFAELAASLEAMSAQIYLAVVIARLVGMRTAPRLVRSDPSPGPVQMGEDPPP